MSVNFRLLWHIISPFSVTRITFPIVIFCVQLILRIHISVSVIFFCFTFSDFVKSENKFMFNPAFKVIVALSQSYILLQQISNMYSSVLGLQAMLQDLGSRDAQFLSAVRRGATNRAEFFAHFFPAFFDQLNSAKHFLSFTKGVMSDCRRICLVIDGFVNKTQTIFDFSH